MVVSIAILALVQSSARAAPTLPDPRSELDLGGSPARCRAMANQLLAKDPAVWREAQGRLAGAGPAALGAVDTRRLLHDAHGRERVRELVQMSLVLHVTQRELDSHPRLQRLVADSIESGMALAARLAERRAYYATDAYDSMVPSDAATPEPLPDEWRLANLGGCAIPAALWLMHSPNPVARAYGIGLVGDLEAYGLVDSVAALSSDTSPVSVWHGDFGRPETVGDLARAGVKRLTWHPRDRGVAYGSQVRVSHHVTLIGGILEYPSARLASTWDEWWDLARPVWRDWWRLAGDGTAPPTREAWLNALREYEGFRLVVETNREPRTVLTVSGPAGARCRVETDSVVVAEGTPPLQVTRDQDSVSVVLREVRESHGDYSGRMFIVTATFPDGRHFRKELLWDPGSQMRVELLPALKPREP